MPHATILYAEDNKFVAGVVCDLLGSEGWTVEVCRDGHSALNRLAAGIRYDLLLFDHGLPGATGLELTRYARSLATYRRTPIIMLSATDCSADARRAGVDLFLRKPDDIHALAEAVRMLTE